MKLTRRSFLKVSGLSLATTALTEFGFNMTAVAAEAEKLRIADAQQVTSICPYCSVGCGQIVHVKDGELLNVEGDPDDPVNEGARCSKGASLFQLKGGKYALENRQQNVLYRAPGAADWEEKTWDWAITEIAKRVKDTRDKTWVATEKIKDLKTGEEKEYVVNRTDGLACFGGAALDTEECYLLTKLSRALGIVYLEHQARLCHSSTVAGLAAVLGRGAMTQQWTDVKNAKAILICGGNPAENHPVAFKHITKAVEENGATLICVDPRFTRSAAKAKIYAPIRPGADLVFFGALINYMINKKHYDENYVKWNTNALWKVDSGYSFDPKTGFFSGYNKDTKKYDQATWVYKKDADGKVEKAADLSDPECVFQKLKAHYTRYTSEMVEKLCGMSQAKFEEIAEILGTQKPSVLFYAMGLTQHTVGSIMIADYAILQLLLGNLGKPGSGINACRGEPNVQGSTDVALLTHILPGYLGAPVATNADLTAWTKAQGTFRKKFLINLLKAWYGNAATAENDFAYSYLPKRNAAKNTTHVGAITAMADGKIKGAICVGMNLMVGTSNTNLVRRALANLEWMVSINLFTEETACFWRDPDGAGAENIQTEVFFLPPAGPYEKEGTFVDSGRVLQWKYKAVEPPGDAKADLDILDMLAHELKSLYKGSKEVKDKPIQDLTWGYGEPPDPEKVLTEMNGYNLTTGKPVTGIGALMADGTTSSGCWIYSGIMAGDPAKGENVNRSKNRNADDPSGYGLYSGFGFSWPSNVRIIYNRASCDPSGNPIDPAKKLVWWDPEKPDAKTGKPGNWTGFDVPDVPAKDAAPGTPGGNVPFRLLGDGVGKLFMAKYAKPQPDPKPDEDPAITKARELELPVLTSGSLVDGPFPEHYEPVESPAENLLNGSQTNPAIVERGEYCPIATSIEEYPHVLSTYRMCEHWLTGVMTRNTPWLVEAMPENFVEINTELAKDKGIKNGDLVEIKTARGSIEVKAAVTERIKPLDINGKKVHIVGTFWHFGFEGLAKGSIANTLTLDYGDANTQIPEYKVCLCDVRKVK